MHRIGIFAFSEKIVYNIIIFTVIDMEIVIIAATIPVLWYFQAKAKIGKPLLVSMVIATILEIVNETVFAGVGTFYPKVLIPFPFFNFPVLIVLLGGIYSGIINFSALKATECFKNRFAGAAAFLTLAALMNSFSILVEKAGIYSGFWQHSQPTGISTIYFAVYIYYLIIVFPASVFIAIGILNQKVSRSSQV